MPASVYKLVQFEGNTNLYEARLVGCTIKHACVQSGLVHSVCVQSGLVCRSYQCIYTTWLGLQLHHTSVMHATRLGSHHTSVYVYNQFWFTGHICMCPIRLGLLVTPGCMCTTWLDLARSVGTAGIVCRLCQRPHSKDKPSNKLSIV